MASRTLVVRRPGVAAHSLSFVLGPPSALRVRCSFGVVPGLVVIALYMPPHRRWRLADILHVLVSIAILEYVAEEPSRRTRAEFDEYENTDEKDSAQVFVAS